MLSYDHHATTTPYNIYILCVCAIPTKRVYWLSDIYCKCAKLKRSTNCAMYIWSWWSSINGCTKDVQQPKWPKKGCQLGWLLQIVVLLLVYISKFDQLIVNVVTSYAHPWTCKHFFVQYGLLLLQVPHTGAEILKCLIPAMVFCSVPRVRRSFSEFLKKISHQYRPFQCQVFEVQEL